MLIAIMNNPVSSFIFTGIPDIKGGKHIKVLVNKEASYKLRKNEQLPV